MIAAERERHFECYSLCLPDHFILSQALALYPLIAAGRFYFECAVMFALLILSRCLGLASTVTARSALLGSMVKT